MARGRFPPPWSAEVTANCFIVRDANGQQLAMTGYLILAIAFIPVTIAIKLLLRFCGVDPKREKLGVVMISGSLALLIIILGFYIAIGILDLLGIVDGHQLACDWHITNANCAR
jgi:hypothetical protein